MVELGGGGKRAVVWIGLALDIVIVCFSAVERATELFTCHTALDINVKTV